VPSERWHQIEELYHAALEREPDQRGAFLDQACAGSGELRQEVESLLAHEASGSGLLAPFAQQAGKLLRGFRGPQHFTPGTQLGPYSVLAPLGAGGMGEVYRARDTRLDRIVAVKVLPAVLRDDPEFQKRFEREARAVSSLNHPHICALYDIGSVGGIDYLVMEYLEGETLTQRMASGPLPLPQVLKYGIQIADALAHAHAQGVLHRDLKPGNIMLTKSGAKLLDFGLAKLRASKSTESVTVTDLTEAGTILGTLHYMSPEQLEGKPAEAASDIFSLGAVLYEMAAGG
jgi:serine/threonine protein kinase